ncbi:MAG TPA: amino acid adenylation domain-containing protein, partial [Longimicrobiaceae bacterium]|nr:amino acid adenylation domain-containing protein [Longimicrobiaceae bacterium]
MQNIQSVYALSPMQQSMLVRILQAPDLEEYTEQIHWVVDGDLDTTAFARAWQQVVDRNPILRTAFFWEGLDSPLQVVRQRAEISIERLDWRSVPPGDRDGRFEELLHADRARGFDLHSAPLTRLTLVRTREREHRCVWSYHHLLLDGWSSALGVREAFACYEALVAGGEPRLEPVRPFEEFISWLSAQDEREAEAFWREELAGFTAPTRLAFDRGEHRAAEELPALVHAILPVPLVEGLRRTARQHGLTLNTLVQGAWGLLLSVYGEEQDVVFGSVSSGRPPTLPGVEASLGIFISTVPTRVRVRPDAELGPWLRELQATQTRARHFDYYPVPQIQGWSEVPAGERLFDTLFVFQNLPDIETRGEEVAGLRVRDFARHTRAVQIGHAMMLEVIPRDGFTLFLTYDERRFDRAVAERVPEHLGALLQAMAEGPERTLSELSPLTAAERARVVEEWNDTRCEFPRDRCLHELFAEQARRTPDAPAAVSAHEVLTYAELDARATRLARFLCHLGVRPEVRVGICVERGTHFAVAVLGVLRAGGAYVPLDPAYPAERLAHLLEDSGARVLLTQEALAGRLPATPARTLLLDAEQEAIFAESAEPVESGAVPENLAYVIYTSGSTGKPKGVAVAHRPVVNYAVDMADRLGLCSDDRILQFASPGFDVVVEELFPTWLAGGAVVFSGGNLFSPPELLRLVAEQGVTGFELPTAYWHEWVHELAHAGLRLPESVRFVLVGGERVSPERLADWARLGLPLVHVFGLTETACTSTTLRLEAGDDGSRWPNLPVGTPTGNVRLYVLDARLQPVPSGIPGELYIGGEGLARGYLGRPDLTAEKFVPDLFSAEPGARLYRTGDRVRWLADGTLEFLGRLDHQVKLRGFRVETGEVEAALAEHPGVREAFVMVREDRPGEQRLAAYLIPGGEAPPVGELRAFLKERVPDYMVPSGFVAMDAFPLTSNGKVERAALPAPEPAAAEREYVAPRDPVEETVAEIWEEVLGTERIGANDDFFALGGHSLLATQVVSRIRTTLHVEVPLRVVFEAPTVEALAGATEQHEPTPGHTRRVAEVFRSIAAMPLPGVQRMLRERGDDVREDAGPGPRPPSLSPDRQRLFALLLREEEVETGSSQPIRPREGKDDPPLSFAQQRLWLLDRMEPGNPVYNVPAALRLRGALDAAALERALGELVRRHESLRTVFAEREGEAVQVIRSDLPVRVPVADLRRPGAAARGAAARRLAREEAVRAFDLARGPLLRALAVRTGEAEWVLLFTMHHIVSDAWSVEVLVDEVSALYEAFRAGRPSPLPALPIQYADYAVWQREWLRGGTLERQLAYWRDRLAGVPPVLEIPTDRPRTAGATRAGEQRTLRLTPAATAAVRAMARSGGTTLFTTMLAGFQALLARYAGQDDVVVGTPVAGRTRVELEGLIGFFVNTLVLRTDLSGDPTAGELVERVREGTLGAFAHQDLPFERLVEELKVDRSLGHTPIFQVLFTLDDATGKALRLGAHPLEPLDVGASTSQFDLGLVVTDEGERLDLRLGFRTALFDGETVERMLAHYARLLEGMAARPGTRLSEVSLLGAEEARRLLVEWNDTGTVVPTGLRAHDLIAAWAEREPGAPAVLFGAETLTYGELEARSNRLARYLLALGVRPETPVALCLDASPDVPVAVLAILKAGGAYVPLDPAYPPERLGLVLDDSAAPLLVTRSSLADRVPATAARVVCLDTERERIARESDAPVAGGALPETLAYVIYTSGSTGRPKGVRVEHRNLVNVLLTGSAAFGMGASDVTPSLSSFAFDIWVFEALVPLASGGATRIVPRERVAEVNWLLREIGDVTTLHTVPALMRQVLAAVREAGPGALPRLRQAFVGGDAVPPDLLAEMRAAFPAATLRVLYGPTEGTVVCAAPRNRVRGA